MNALYIALGIVAIPLIHMTYKYYVKPRVNVVPIELQQKFKCL